LGQTARHNAKEQASRGVPCRGAVIQQDTLGRTVTGAEALADRLKADGERTHQVKTVTGDTLMIRGTGRTDFQNGDPRAQYESLFGRLLRLPDETLVYPAHDYKGDTVSTVGEEKAYNPRLQVKSPKEYVTLMNGLKLKA
jgi:hypothetical protein